MAWNQNLFLQIKNCKTQFPLVANILSFIPRRASSKGVSLNIEQPYKLFMLNVGPDKKTELTKEDALKYYHQMFMMRKFEQKNAELYRSRDIRGFCHLYSGQEACATGMYAAMRDVDTLITSYRCHGWVYLMGCPVKDLIAELVGKVTGNTRGKGGSMHVFAKNFFGGNGIVGAQVPLGVGSAFAHKYKGTKGVCFILYGDGAANQGQVFESYNLAKLYNLPAIFVCENNKYAMGTSDNRGAASPEFYKRGCYIPGIWVDGMDVLAVREATRFALAHVIANKGPVVMELETYRYFGHSMSDPGTSYRTREEVQKVKASKDPITHFKEKIIAAKLATDDELKNMEKEINKQVDTIAEQARKDPDPPLDELATDIYVKPIVEKVRGVSPFSPYKHKNIGKRLT